MTTRRSLFRGLLGLAAAPVLGRLASAVPAAPFRGGRAYTVGLGAVTGRWSGKGPSLGFTLPRVHKAEFDLGDVSMADATNTDTKAELLQATPGKEPAYVPPEIRKPAMTVEEAIERVDRWSGEQQFGVHDVGRVLRAEVARLEARVTELQEVGTKLVTERRAAVDAYNEAAKMVRALRGELTAIARRLTAMCDPPTL